MSESRDLTWHPAMRLGKRAALYKIKPQGAKINELERSKASFRGKVEHPHHTNAHRFGFVKVRYRELKQNAAQLIPTFCGVQRWSANAGRSTS